MPTELFPDILPLLLQFSEVPHDLIGVRVLAEVELDLFVCPLQCLVIVDTIDGAFEVGFQCPDFELHRFEILAFRPLHIDEHLCRFVHARLEGLPWAISAYTSYHSRTGTHLRLVGLFRQLSLSLPQLSDQRTHLHVDGQVVTAYTSIDAQDRFHVLLTQGAPPSSDRRIDPGASVYPPVSISLTRGQSSQLTFG